MTSVIDVTKPVQGTPSTQSVRDNFATAYAEITALQTQLDDLGLDITTIIGSYLQLAGGVMTGAISFGSTFAPGVTDLTKHISLHGDGYGFNVTTDRMNVVLPATKQFNVVVNSVDQFTINDTNATFNVGIVTVAKEFYAGDPSGAYLWLSSFFDGWSTLFFNKSVGNKGSSIGFGTNNENRWLIDIGSRSGDDELGADTGSDFSIKRYADTGTLLDTAFQITRSTGGITFTNDVNANKWLTTGTNTASGSLIINGPVLSGRQIRWATAGVTRFSTSLSTAVESGSNAGADWLLGRYDDSGAYISYPIVVYRSTGNVQIRNGLSFQNAMAASTSDLSVHLTIHSAGYGMNITAGRLNIIGAATSAIVATIAGVDRLTIAASNWIQHGDGTSTADYRIKGGAGFVRQISFYSGLTTARWSFQVTSNAESGSNIGSDFAIYRYDDAGVSLGIILQIKRDLGTLLLYTGFQIGATAASTTTDLSKHIALFSTTYGFNVSASRINYVGPTGVSHVFVINAVDIGLVSSTGLNAMIIGATTPAAGTFTSVKVGSTSGPTWTVGTGVPATAPPQGSLFSRTDGAVGSTLYVRSTGSVWTPVAGV